jgi:drug/metabolite transporter (DMT)-like permease
MMRASLIAGIVLIAAGIFLILRPIHYSTQQSVVKLGSFQATVQQQQTLPAWVAGAVLGAGVVLLGASLFKRF